MPRRRAPIAAAAVTRCLLGVVLLGAACLKGHQLATGPVIGEGILASRWFLTLWVELEIVLGVWLLSGLCRRAAWVAGLGCFALFTVVTLGKALRGDTSCGCFGRVEVNPWYTLVLDVVAVGALVLCRRGFLVDPGFKSPRLRLAVAVGLCLAAGVPLGLGSALYSPTVLGKDGQVVGAERTVVLEPKSWVGTPCPLLAHIDVGQRLSKGRWTVVLYHHDCPHCERRVPEMERQARQLAARHGGTKVAMVELAPYAPAGRSLLSPDSPCLTGRVNDLRDWFVGTPTVLTLMEGVVLDAEEGGGPSEEVRSRLASLTPVPDEELLAYRPEGHDFGYVKLGSIHNVLLGVPNPADVPLRVTEVQSECACMGAVASEGRVRPGQPLAVRVLLKAPKKAYQYDKRILLKTDSSAHPAIPVRIRAAVGLPLYAEPSRVDFGRVAPGTSAEHPVRIVNRLEQPVRLLYSTSNLSGCFARVPRQPVPANGVMEVPVVVRPDREGEDQVAVRIQTNLDQQPTVIVTACFTVQGTAKGTAKAVAARPESVLEKGR